MWYVVLSLIFFLWLIWYIRLLCDWSLGLFHHITYISCFVSYLFIIIIIIIINLYRTVVWNDYNWRSIFLNL